MREGDRVRKEYVGAGEAAGLIARMEQLERDKAEAARLRERRELAGHAALERQAAEVCALAETLARLALLAAGYHRHHRGAWRKRRG